MGHLLSVNVGLPRDTELNRYLVLTGRIELRVSRSTTERPAIERSQERLNGHAGNGRGYGGRTRHSSLMRAGPFPTEAPRGIGKRGRTRTCGDRNQNPAP